MRRASVLVTLALAVGLAGATAQSGRPFSVDPLHVFAPPLRHGESGVGVHEQITQAAIFRGLPSASRNLIINLKYGVGSTDFMHHFDAEYHFDNASTRTNPKAFRFGFDAIRRHLASARKYASGNPQFLKPTYRSLREIRAELDNALAELAGREDCDACSRVKISAYRLTLTLMVPALKAYPSPDPHPPTNDRSVFAPSPPGDCGLCGALGFVGRDFPQIVNDVEGAAAYGVSASSSFGPRDPLRRKLVRLFQAVRAYRAFSDLGHAFHTTQDFFAHSNYVELMAGVPVGRPIPKGTRIEVPATFDEFSPQGLRRFMGDERYGRLETGAVAAIWLNEGDFCLGSPYNPSSTIQVALSLGVQALASGAGGGSMTLGSGGTNPNPPPGFNYCHYQTETTVGLNKDDPDSLNHAPARQAALDVSALLWKHFLESLGPAPKEDTGSPLPNLAGTWKGQDGGLYVVSQAKGSADVSWEGCSADGGQTWTHTFAGRILGDSLVGHFKDHPPGRLRNEGDLALDIVSENKLVWIGKLTVGGKTYTSFPTLTRTWTRAKHGGFGTSEPPPASTSWAGMWDTNFGTMTLTQTGTTVSGSYTYQDGKVDGTVSGNVLQGTWSEAPRASLRDRGSFRFTLSADGRSFTGEWNYADDPAETWRPNWNGSRL